MATKRTHRGDDGSTGVPGEERLPKYHLRIETLGSLDEASAALGLARSMTDNESIVRLILEAQRQLYILMSEIAHPAGDNSNLPCLQASHLEWIDSAIQEMEKTVVLPTKFILPGDNPASGALGLARTIVRRAERRAVELHDLEPWKNEFIIPWLNRLSWLIYFLEIFVIRDRGVEPSLTEKNENLPKY